ncbi:MAG: DUF1848 domain-containing protein [Rikenellaceae bacterium]|nr:DUF1848 domain-containing protein [Rikenellaceae bacterium]
MVISASRRTDIPAFYSKWFFNRVKAGEVYVRNPFDKRKVSRVSLRREHVDFIQFWTKNPAPMLPRLRELEGYDYTFHFTVNGYGKALEPNVPQLPRLVETFAGLSRHCKVSWRYSPIIIKDGFGVEEHLGNFSKIASCLEGLTDRCYISLLDEYPKIRHLVRRYGLRSPDENQQEIILAGVKSIAQNHGINVYSCAERKWQDKYGIVPGQCLDPAVVGRNAGIYKKDPNQRPECACSQSVDIGGYSSCPHDCIYCYANRATGIPGGEYSRHDPLSPLVTGRVRPQDMISEHSLSCRARKLYGELTGTLFDEL